MATREEFNACIKERMSGKTFTVEERKQAFCVSAKICSGKVSSESEAGQICSLPKPPKEPKTKGTKRKGVKACQDQMAVVAGVLAEELGFEEAFLRERLQEVGCGTAKNKPAAQQPEELSTEEVEAVRMVTEYEENNL